MSNYPVAGSLQAEKNELTIENAVILSEDKAAYILHKYKEISYVSGQRAVWSEIGSSIVCQGLVVSDLTALSFCANKSTLEEAFPNGEPSYYTSGTMITATADAEPIETIWEMYLESYSDNRYYYRVKYSRDGGETWNVISTRYISWYVPSPGIYFTFNSITPQPDSSRPYGYINVTASVLVQNTSTEGGAYNWTSSSAAFLPYMYMPFANEAEKNAAIALTYEPAMVKSVEETTEITE